MDNNKVPQNMKWAYIDHRSGLWASQIRIDGRKIHLGLYETAEDAHAMASAVYNVRMKSKRSLHHIDRKPRLSFEKAAEIRKEYADGEQITALAIKNGVSYRTIMDVIEYRTWVPKEA